MKIIFIVGVRPEFIQADPVIKEFKKHDLILVHTGQHYDYEMSRIFFDELSIPEPDYHLGVGSRSHGHQTAEILKGVEDVLLNEEPDCVFVFGDTNSTLSGALASVKIHIPLAHIEAGLRSFDRQMPEEINRVIVDHISNLLFSPTETAIDNLNKEGIFDCVYNTGDVMYDSLKQKIDLINDNKLLLREYELEPNKYFLITLHRSENTENINNLKEVLRAVGQSNRQFIFPIHPRTEKLLKNSSIVSILNDYNNIKLIEPLGYINFLRILQGSFKVLTDSGGVQKQAFMLGIPCITLRENTEWVETVESGWNVLAGTNRERIINMINNFEPRGERMNVYGDGNASKKILRVVNSI